MLRTPLRVLLALAVLVLAAAVPVAAQSEDGPPTVTYVDARDSVVQLAMLNGVETAGSSDIELEQRGENVPVLDVTTTSAADWPLQVVFVVDVDNRNAGNGELTTIVSAIRETAAALPEGSTFGLVTAGRTADVHVPFTTSLDRIETGLGQIVVDQGSALVDGASLAGRMFADHPLATSRRVVRSVVVVSGGADTTSTSSTAAASSSLLQSGAQLMLVSLGSPATDLANLSSSVGGDVVSAASKDEIRSAISSATLTGADRTLVSFRGLPPEGDGPADDRANLRITVGEQSRLISYPVGIETDNILQLAPLPETENGPLGFLGNSIVLYFSIALAFVGISMGVWALASMLSGGETRLDRVLARYSEGQDVDDEEVREMLVQTELLQRAVDLTESFARRRGFLTRVEDLLERADLPIRPGEGMFFLIGLVALIFGLSWTTTGSLVVGLITAAAAGAIAYAVVVFLASRRLRVFEGQLPDTLQLLAGTLRAGYSLPQGLDAVSNEIGDPMGEELRRAMAEAQLGRELEDALGAVAERLNSDDFAWTVMAIGIQREVGGNLNELLMTVAETMVQRERLKREVAALTAEGRVSALILSLLPPGLGVVLYVMNPEYVGVLFSRTIGLILLGLAVVSGMIGLLWMKKVITIDA